MDYRLYYSPGACSLAVHVVLEEIGAPYALEEISLARAENRQASYLAINPKGFVPALEIAGESRVLTELPAILVYLAKQHPQAGLLPNTNAIDEARALEWLSWLAGWVHGVGYAELWRPERFSAADPAPHDALRANGRRIVQEACVKIERMLGDGRVWAVPSGYCIVDPFLLVLYRWGNRIGIRMRDECPAWTAHAEHMLERAAVRRVFEREGVAIE